MSSPSPLYPDRSVRPRHSTPPLMSHTKHSLVSHTKSVHSMSNTCRSVSHSIQVDSSLIYIEATGKGPAPALSVGCWLCQGWQTHCSLSSAQVIAVCSDRIAGEGKCASLIANALSVDSMVTPVPTQPIVSARRTKMCFRCRSSSLRVAFSSSSCSRTSEPGILHTHGWGLHIGCQQVMFENVMPSMMQT